MAGIVDFMGNGIHLEWYQTDHAVYPKAGSPDPTDVMLIQFLLRQFFMTPLVSQRKEFWCLHDKAIIGGKRWDDGVYGPNTREGVRLFEVSTYSPYKDGIVRPFPMGDGSAFTSDFPNLTKLGKLNWMFDRTHSLRIEEKRHIIRMTANPILSERLVGTS